MPSCAFLPGTEPLRRVSILPRGLALGATQQAAQGGSPSCLAHGAPREAGGTDGGYAAEEDVLGDVSAGAESDFKQATDLATDMLAHYGMSERLGPTYYEHHAERPFLRQRVALDGTVAVAAMRRLPEGEP
jgi:cell division protease FtsH